MSTVSLHKKKRVYLAQWSKDGDQKKRLSEERYQPLTQRPLPRLYDSN
jgi:hypothetical protein